MKVDENIRKWVKVDKMSVVLHASLIYEKKFNIMGLKCREFIIFQVKDLTIICIHLLIAP